MDIGWAVELGRKALLVGIFTAAPLLLAALLTGLLVGIFQTATQLHEQALSFIPRILVMALALAIFLPFMLKLLTNFTQRMIAEAPMLIR